MSVLTSDTLRSIKAYRKLPWLLIPTAHPSTVPMIKLKYSLEGMIFGVGGLGEGDSLVRVANAGQVFKITMLVLVGMETKTGLDLPCAHTALLLESSSWVWEPSVYAPTHRVVGLGAVEEELFSVGTVKKILQDVDFTTREPLPLSKEVVFHLWHYHNATKEEKVRELSGVQCHDHLLLAGHCLELCGRWELQQ